MHVKNIQRLMTAVWISFILVGCGGNSSTPSIPLSTICANLNGKKIDNAAITSTQWHEASDSYPAFCQVNATRAPYLDMEIDLPENWSGRLWQQGGAASMEKSPPPLQMYKLVI